MSLLLQLLLLKLAPGNDGGGAGAAAAAAGSARYSFYLATFLFGTYLAVFCCLVVVGAVAGMWWRGAGTSVVVGALDAQTSCC